MPHNPFHHHENEIWQELASQLGGELIDREGWQQDKVIVRSGGWTVTVDFRSAPAMKEQRVQTRIAAPLREAGGFRFSIAPETMLGRVGQVFGLQDVKVGVPELDRRFAFRTNDEQRLRRLVADPKVALALQREDEVHLSLDAPSGWAAEQLPAGTDVLTLLAEGQVESLARLHALYDLFSAILKSVGGTAEPQGTTAVH